MRTDEALKLLCVKTNLSYAEISRRLNRTPQAFGQKLKRGKLSVSDLQDIAMVSGCRLERAFRLPNGETIPIQ